MKKIITFVLCGLMVFSSTGCSTLSKTAGGAMLGSGAGAVLGAVVGTFISKDAKGAAIGAAIGTAVGGGTGAIIGHKMDKKAEELAKLEGAKVETITDINGLEAIKVTFDSGILFELNKSNLSSEAQTTLAAFAANMADLTDTDITIYGHTDNTGSAAVNEKLSAQRAESVATFLNKKGIAKERITTAGMSFNMPVADNATAEGRALNRRVEVYVSANEKMIEAAQNGTLK